MPFKNLLHKGMLMAVMVMVLASLITVTGAQASGPKKGGTLKIAALGLDTADPHRHTGSIAVQQAYVETLTSIANDGSVIPFLAESWDIAPDGLTYTFKIRKGVKFHNGREMNAKDVMANFARVKENVTKGWLASAMKQVASFKAPADYTFVVKMKKPYAAFLNLISELWILAPESPGWDKTITQPIGTGPFTFGEWIPKDKLVAPAHKEYWQKGLPHVEAVQFDLRDDSQGNPLALRSGDLHVARVGRDMIPTLKKNPDIEIQSLKDSTWYFWSFNNRTPNPPFDNVRVREALCYTLDKKAYMDFIAGGAAVITNQMVMPGNFYFDQAVHNADRHAKADLAKAKKILAEEGVDPAKVTVKVVSWQSPYAEVAVQMIKKLGFKVDHQALDDLGTQKLLGGYKWDVAPMASGPRADIFLRYVRMMSDGPNPVLWGGVQDPKYDDLCSKAISEVDAKKRRDYYLQAWQIVMDQYYTVVVGHASNAFGVRTDLVQGFETGYTWSQHRVDGGVAHAWLTDKARK
jgi:peptide/nickel transport system substrate-binding protein